MAPMGLQMAVQAFLAFPCLKSAKGLLMVRNFLIPVFLQMTAQLQPEPLLPCHHSLSCFSDETKDSGTLSFQKSIETIATFIQGAEE